jgi:predicted negative regulator of RcsB-dependent stress response
MSEETTNYSLKSKAVNLIKKNVKNLIILFTLIILIFFGYLFNKDLNYKKEIKISEDYTLATINFKEKKRDEAKKLLENIIIKSHRFYSPLALYFIIDNNLETDSLKIINFFDKILLIKSIDEENLNLIKIKKAIFLFELGDEDTILKTLNPIINSKSVWREMAIKLISNYFLSSNQKTKANEYLQLLDGKIKK